MKPEELRKRLENVEKGLAEDESTTEFPTSGPREEREYTFVISWKDGRGKLWKGTFTNRVLSIRDRQTVGLMRARMAVGVALDSLDSLTSEINLMIAHLSVSLIKRPDWASDLGALDEVRLLQEIYMEVLNHEATFFGYGKNSDASGDKSESGEHSA